MNPKKFLLALFSMLSISSSFLDAKKSKDDAPPENSNENILRHPRVYNMRMSPDGNYAASLAPIGKEGDRGIVIFDLKSMEIHRSFDWTGREIDTFNWTTNEDIAIHVTKWGMYVDGVYSVNVNRKKIYALLNNDAVIDWVDTIPQEPTAWIWIKDGNELNPGLAKLAVRGNAERRISLNGGTTIILNTNENPLVTGLIKNPPGQVYAWWTDQNHEPRVTLRFFEDKLEYLLLDSETEEWSTVDLDPEEWEIQFFDKTPNIVYVAGYNGENTKGLFPYNLDTKEIGDLVYRDDFYDFSDSAVYQFFKGQIVGFRYQRDKPKFVWLAPELQSIQRMIDRAIPGKVNIIYDSNNDFSRHLVCSYSDRTPAEYSVLDLREKSLKLLTKSAPWLDSEKLLPTKTFQFKTSDGLKLEGYLTRPANTSGPAPTICLVHGGPWARDNAGYDDEAQLFAQNGYAVLRVNYRGSSGYGKTVSEDSAYDFRKMQDDITEAVKVAIKHKIADPDRIAILGASFGGYSAICGAAFEPDLYRCAITNMGVFDWEELIKSRKRQDSRYSHYKLLQELGDPKENLKKFEEISPIYHIEKIKIPIFVIHGKDDRNVSIHQSKLLSSELEKYGVEHETMYLSDEGHSVFSTEKRIKVYDAILAFLEKNMK